MSAELVDGMLRLTPGDWAGLVEASTLPVELSSVPGLPQAVTATRAPVVRLQLDVGGAALTTRHAAWIDHDAVALLARVHDDVHQLIPSPPSMLAGALVRLTGLGPVRTGRARSARAVEEEVLDDLWHDDDLRRGSAYAALGVDRAWILATDRPDRPGSERRLSAVRDVEGWWLAEPAESRDEGWQLVPTTPTLVWRLLTSLLLDDDLGADQD